VPLQFPFAYLVAIDFNTPEADYTPLANEISRSYNWWRYLKNTWIVLRYESLLELQPLLTRLLGVNDRMLILPAHGPAAGWLPKEAYDWIQNNVPQDWGTQPAWPPAPSPEYLAMRAKELPPFAAPPPRRQS
jgi:hypothetical protein